MDEGDRGEGAWNWKVCLLLSETEAIVYAVHTTLLLPPKFQQMHFCKLSKVTKECFSSL